MSIPPHDQPHTDPGLSPTPVLIDSASTVFVANDRCAVKKSVWLLRCAAVLQEGVSIDPPEISPVKTSDRDNCANPQTKYVTVQVWLRHLHYTHNLDGDPPP